MSQKTSNKKSTRLRSASVHSSPTCNFELSTDEEGSVGSANVISPTITKEKSKKKERNSLITRLTRNSKRDKARDSPDTLTVRKEKNKIALTLLSLDDEEETKLKKSSTAGKSKSNRALMGNSASTPVAPPYYLRYPVADIVAILQFDMDKCETVDMYRVPAFLEEINQDFSFTSLLLYENLRKRPTFTHTQIDWILFDKRPYDWLLVILHEANRLMTGEEAVQILTTPTPISEELSGLWLAGISSQPFLLDIGVTVDADFPYRWYCAELNVASAIPDLKVDEVVSVLTGYSDLPTFISAICRARKLPAGKKRYLCLDDFTMKNNPSSCPHRNDSYRLVSFESASRVNSVVAYLELEVCKSRVTEVDEMAESFVHLAVDKPKLRVTSSPAVTVSPLALPAIKAKRKNLPSALRLEVWKRQFNTFTGYCWVCEKVLEYENHHTSHRISVKNGGTDTADNLYPCCASCNLSMSSMNMDEYLIAYYPQRYAQLGWGEK